MGQARKAALHLLNNDWGRAVWKHWLSNIFVPPVEPPKPANGSGSAPTPAEFVNVAPSNSAVPDASCAEPRDEAPEPGSSRDARRSELRVRFEALGDRLMAVEEGLDALLRRSVQREKS